MTRYPGCTKSCPRGSWVGSKPLLCAPASCPSAQPAPSFLSAPLAFLDHPPPAPRPGPAPPTLPRDPLRSHLAAGPRQRLAGQGGQPSWWWVGSREQTLGGFIWFCSLGWGGWLPTVNTSSFLAAGPQGGAGPNLQPPPTAAPSRSLWPSFCFGKAEPARGRGHFSAAPGRGRRPLLHHLRGAARPEKGERIPQIHSLLSLSPG